MSILSYNLPIVIDEVARFEAQVRRLNKRNINTAGKFVSTGKVEHGHATSAGGALRG